MNKIAIIPARSASKGLPNKNILNLYGKPLICWTIEAAIKTNIFSKIIVSTDSVQYGKICEKYGIDIFYRSAETSSDMASTFDVINELYHKIDYVKKCDYFVLLQPTSPFRNEDHIKSACKLYEKNYNSYNTLVSLKKSHKSSALIKPIDEDYTLKYFDIDFSKYRRQNYCEYEPNGAIFISKMDSYLKNKHFFGKQGMAYIMSDDDSIDIDNMNDFEYAISLLRRKNKKMENYNLAKERIKQKSIYNKDFGNEDITLIGHSFFDKWIIDRICGLKVNNLGINGSTAESFYNEFLNKTKISYLGKYVIVMFGTNEIIYEKDINNIVFQINKVIKEIRKYDVDKIFFLNIPNVNGYIDRDNSFINECYDIFKTEIMADKIISLKNLNDEFGWLNLEYTFDGLHLNENGYAKFLSIIEEEISGEL